MRKGPTPFSTPNDNELSYDPETRTFAAGETRELVTWCDWVELLAVTSDAMQVSLNGSFFFPFALGLILRPRLGIRRLFLKNTSGAANTVVISKGLGAVDDRRLVLTTASILNVNPVPTAYNGRINLSGVVGSAFANSTLVAAGSNLNGVLVNFSVLWCGSDPTALARLSDGSLIAEIGPDSVAVIPSFVVPAGNAFAVAIQGLTKVNGTYRIL